MKAIKDSVHGHVRLGDVAAELEVDENDLLAVEDGRAATANVGGSVVRALEERFGIDVVDE